MNARRARVDDEQDAPSLGEIGAHQDGRRTVLGAAAPVDDEAAALEGSHADGRARAALEDAAELANTALDALQRQKRRPDREGELGSRAEARMRRDSACHVELVGGRRRVDLGEAAQRRQRAVAVGAVRLAGAGTGEDELCCRAIDGKPDAAEAASQVAVEIEEAQVETCRGNDANGAGRPAAHGGRRSLGGKLGLRCVGQRHYFEPRSISVHKRRGGDNMTAEREKPMPDAEVAAWLQQNLPKWRLEDGWIRRTYKTNGWKGTLMVINTVGHLAEAAWHHPDITASYAWVEVRLMTHTAKGITGKDLELAKKIEEVVQWQPGKEGRGLEGTPATDMRFAYIKYD